MIQGFKEFIARGNVIDLAVGVIIGAAFGKVVDALVNSVLMPAIAKVVGNPNFDSLWQVPGTDIKFGVLVTALVNFLLIALAVYFAIVLPMNKLNERRLRKAGIDPNAPDPETPEVSLLKEIRDELRASSGGRHEA